jgi:hypothetical protein
VGSALLTGLLIACGGERIAEPQITPGLPLPRPSDPQPELPQPSGASPLIGSWRGVNRAFMPTHIQTLTWRFSPDGSCSQTFLTIADGVELTETRACVWVADSQAATVTVTRMGVTQPVSFTLRYSFPSINVLRLDGDEYSRVG